MKKQDKLNQYDLTVRAIQYQIKRYQEHVKRCALCEYIPSLSNGKHQCNICLNESFKHLVSKESDFPCPAMHRPNTKAYTESDLSEKYREKVILFWQRVYDLFTTRKECVINKMNGNKTYNKDTWLAKSIRAIDENIN